MALAPLRSPALLLLAAIPFFASCGSGSAPASAAPENGLSFDRAQQTVQDLIKAQQDFKSRHGYFATLDTLVKDRSVRLPPTGKGQDGWGYVFDVKPGTDSFQVVARCYAPPGKFCSELIGDQSGQITMNIKPGQ